MTHPRTVIRNYAKAALEDKVDVDGRVFLNRPSSLLLSELPALVVYFTNEIAEINQGDQYVPQAYERILSLTVDVLAESNEIDEDVETVLDSLAKQVETCFFNDIFFSKRLPGYNGNITDDGLLAGSRLINTMPEDLSDENSETIIACQSIVFELVYLDQAFTDSYLDDFDEYDVKFNRVGWDEDTIDPTLIEADGEIDES